MKLLASLLILLSTQTIDLKQKAATDRTLIVPGVGANTILLKDSISHVQQKTSKDITVVQARSPLDLFTHIFKTPCDLKIGYTSIYYYNSDTVIFFLDNKVTGIGITNKDRVTSDLVSIKKGANNFVFKYGNKGLQVLKNSNHKLYLYKSRGIGIIDDKDDDAIDMVLIFQPVSGQ